MKEISADNAVFPPDRRTFMRREFTVGLPLSFFGLFVYGFLRLIGKKPHDYRSVCRYFVVGRKWGGVSLGFFFICDSDDERLRRHEFGHCVQNATVGGFRMLGYSIASGVRYWRYRTREKHGKQNKKYDSWHFERNATLLGEAYEEKGSNR